VTGWQPYRDKILAAQLPQIENRYYRFREVFFNGQRQIRACYPNRDPQDPRFGGWAFIHATLLAEDSAPVRIMGEQGVFPRQWAKPDQGEIFIIPGLAWNAEPEGCIVENNVFVNSNVYQFDAVIGEDASGIRFRRNIISYAKPDASLMRAGRAWKDETASYKGWQESDFNVDFQSEGASLRIADLPGESFEDWTWT